LKTIGEFEVMLQSVLDDIPWTMEANQYNWSTMNSIKQLMECISMITNCGHFEHSVSHKHQFSCCAVTKFSYGTDLNILVKWVLLFKTVQLSQDISIS